jgi:hypothetical protein
MKKITSLKFAVAVMAIACFTMVLKSCKKVDNNTVTPKDALAALATAQKAIIAQYGNVSAGVVIPINKSADEYFYKNASGKMASLYATNKGGDINRPTPCIANCNNTTNPADLYINYNLDQAERYYECESNGTKSTVFVKWTINVPFDILDPLTIHRVSQTFGKIKFTTALGVVTEYTTPNVSDVTAKLVGPAVCQYNKIYEITYKLTGIPNSSFASGTQLGASVSLDTDCGLLGYVTASGYVTAPTFSQNGYLPCNRIDKMYVFSTLQVPGPYATALGNSNTCAYPTSGGFVPIDYHQLEYRLKTSLKPIDFDWNNQTSPIYWGILYGTSTPSPTITGGGSFNLVNMTPGSGKWLVRYRNVKTSTCDVIQNNGIFPNIPNPSPGDAQAGAYWGNTALWFTEVVQQ